MPPLEPFSPHDEPHHETAWDPVPIPWPLGKVPVEIFELICTNLTRPEVKALRLVCREFDNKISSQYFRNVVVPFRSELYGNLTREEDGTLKCSTSGLFSSGMRIFESFGPHIRRFALSLEIDEESFAHPPIKPVQRAISAFWGVYRWPHESYHRYTDLDGIEQTADEQQGMTEALRHLTHVNNLGLCCDAGLGHLLNRDQHISIRGKDWSQPVFSTRDRREDGNLSHPILSTRYQREDGNLSHPIHSTQDWHEDGNLSHPVFSIRDWAEGGNMSRPIIASINLGRITKRDRDELSSEELNLKQKILEAMLSEGGFKAGAQMDEAARVMFETEGVSLETLNFGERSSGHERGLTLLQGSGDGGSRGPNHRWPLLPSNLSRAQKELLLELEWAHRAMIQSYVIGITDNAAEGRFLNLTTLTIAKIPSSHIQILCRRELWTNLTTLKNVSLGIMADWRRISRSNLGSIDDISISPTEAVAKAFKLLNWYIGPRSNIESVHFEWICGGEFAAGSYQRNSFVLPAPFVESANLMTKADIVRDYPDELLQLPHVKHLSLKNCWSSPHILVQVLRQMALVSLEKLELESVSLCGPPMSAILPAFHPINIQLPDADETFTAASIMSLFIPQTNSTPPPPGVPAPTFVPASTPFSALVALPQHPLPPVGRVDQPLLMFWTGILDHFSPGPKVRDAGVSLGGAIDPAKLNWEHNLHHAAPFVTRYRALQEDELKYKLTRISVKSCGYVLIDASRVNTNATLPPETQNGAGGTDSQGMDSLTQYCKEKLCGRILAYLQPAELECLGTVFGMRPGWEGIYDQATYEAAMSDGVEHPGRGRFSGVLRGKDDMFPTTCEPDSAENIETDVSDETV